MEETFLYIIEILGTLAFAISGIRFAAAKRFDWFGAFVVGLVTAIGGGSLRDMLLNLPVFWMGSWMYIAVTGLSLMTVIIFRQALVKGMRTLFVFDAIGLALFNVVGIQKTLATGYPMWVAIIMGMVTGAFGGIVRDVLLNEVPLFFRKDIYATACIAGGLAYWVLMQVPGIASWVPQVACAIVVIGLRIAAVHYNLSLPILHLQEKDLPQD